MLSFPAGTKMVHFPAFASRLLLYSEADIPTLLGISLEDSDIPGSQPVCGSPRLFAAYHVLLRLPSPRHPPYALSSLTIKFAPPENPLRIPSYQANSTALACLDFFYPSLSDCQRSIVRYIPETKGSSPSPWFQAQNRTAGHRRHWLVCPSRPTFGFDLQRLPATPKVSQRPLLRLLIPASIEGLYSRNG